MAHSNGSKWITRNRRLAIYLRDGLECAFCGCQVIAGARGNRDGATLDHLHAGNDHKSTNLVTSCLGCNARKGDMDLDAWYLLLEEDGEDVDAIRGRVNYLTRVCVKESARRALFCIRFCKALAA